MPRAIDRVIFRARSGPVKFAAAAIGAIGIAILTGTPAIAQDEAADAAAMTNEFEALKACRTIADDSQRLACFDNAVGVVVAAEESGDLRVVDRETADNTRRRLFGFSIPDLGIFGGGDDEDEMDELTTTVTSVRQLRGNSWVFRTAEGATWQINNAPTRRLRSINVGDSVVFKRASMGSFFIRIEGRIGVKGKRIE